ncbi:MAG: hypothetical protein NZL83_03325 [Candidatus Absconditabacterales bacterium]|nr:hypothetical protein [Candidatus Absconditabacterales bacterium]
MTLYDPLSAYIAHLRSLTAQYNTLSQQATQLTQEMQILTDRIQVNASLDTPQSH